MKNVLVTGASGHLDYSLTKHLLDQGYCVRASVRCTRNMEKIQALKNLDVEIVEADLMNKASLRRALAGVDGLFQVAAIFNITSNNPEQEVVQPNIEGTQNILEAAAEAGVKKVVYTSSIAAIGPYRTGEQPRDESHWNHNSPEPYARSKSQSERLAWELAGRLKLNLATVLPGAILGPQFRQLTPSLHLIREVLRNKIPMAYPMALSYVDVRDVADAHVRVYENASSSGRYIATHSHMSVAETCMLVKKLRPAVKTSARELPKSVAWMMPTVDYLQNKITGAPRMVNRNILEEYLGKEQNFQPQRLKQELNWQPRPIEDTFRETLETIEKLQL